MHGLESAPPCSAPDASQPQVDDEIEDEVYIELYSLYLVVTDECLCQ